MQSKTLAPACPALSPSLPTSPINEPVPPDSVERAPDVPPILADAGVAARASTAEVLLPKWRSEDLLGAADEAQISHGDQVYRLRRTTTGKLILTK